MYKLVLKVDIEPVKWRTRITSYFVSDEFKLGFSLTNIGDEIFPGGNMTIMILWPNRQFFKPSYRIPEIKPKETKKATDVITDEPINILRILASGYGLFYLKNTSTIEKKPFILYDSPDSDRGIWRDYAFHSILGKEPEELYQLWALWAAVFSLLILVSEKVFHFLKWIISIFN